MAWGQRALKGQRLDGYNLLVWIRMLSVLSIFWFSILDVYNLNYYCYYLVLMINAYAICQLKETSVSAMIVDLMGPYPTPDWYILTHLSMAWVQRVLKGQRLDGYDLLIWIVMFNLLSIFWFSIFDVYNLNYYSFFLVLMINACPISQLKGTHVSAMIVDLMGPQPTPDWYIQTHLSMALGQRVLEGQRLDGYNFLIWGCYVSSFVFSNQVYVWIF